MHKYAYFCEERVFKFPPRLADTPCKTGGATVKGEESARGAAILETAILIVVVFLITRTI